MALPETFALEAELPALADNADPDLMRQVLEEAGKFVGEVVAPLNRDGDEIGADALAIEAAAAALPLLAAAGLFAMPPTQLPLWAQVIVAMLLVVPMGPNVTDASPIAALPLPVLQPASTMPDTRCVSSADVNDGNAGTIRLLAVACCGSWAIVGKVSAVLSASIAALRPKAIRNAVASAEYFFISYSALVRL